MKIPGYQLAALLLTLLASPIQLLFAQQLPDTAFTFPIPHPAYTTGQGPLILIDGGHNNLHTLQGGYAALGKLMEQDGYRVETVNSDLSSTGLMGDAEILIISNALNRHNLGNWILPTPSAFTEDEIQNIKAWVKNGGKLFLIADHMPFAGAASDLAKAFGFSFLNGFAMTSEQFWPPSEFSLANGGLVDTIVVSANSPEEKIKSVRSFSGSAFQIPDAAIPLLQFTENHHSLQPDTAWRFNKNTASVNLENYYQGAVMEFGKGKIAVFGEAAMFTAQIANGKMKVGFNSDLAPDNARFALNLIHWLDGISDYDRPSSELPSLNPEEKILQLNREMEEAFKANEFLKVASFYSDEGVMIGNRHEVHGRRAIDNYWLGLENRGVSWELENLAIEVYDVVAIQRGISRMKYLHEGKEYLSEVRFTLIWNKSGDGWKIGIDHYSLL